ncbi:hypothetical protein HA052_09030 [Chromobacterium haemolyticum]|uniref:DUF4178 domain-containing protein n=1 Tax=Chromobacterium fluminis TaxID=3044269 RepID=A0ABX0L3G2_9NEIS|nr:hypothetical protein [Chromobacterium haemolyticum]NHR05345.1 hypothetical protein [Chromobacterium haemolyticum]
MANAIKEFDVIESPRKPGCVIVYFDLLHNGQKTGVKVMSESVFAQYWMEDSERYFLVFQNAPWEETNYEFYLLTKDFLVLDRVHLFSPDGRDDELIDSYELKDGVFSFRKYENGNRYNVLIDKKGKIRYAFSDFKYRLISGALKPVKYLQLTPL